MQTQVRIVMSVIVLILFASFGLLGCASVNHNLYWNESASGYITTNDVARLQKVVPFNIVLPKYFPDGIKSYKFEMSYHRLDNVSSLDVNYNGLTRERMISITEGLMSEAYPDYPQPLPEGLFAKMYPDYTPQELSGVEVLFHGGFASMFWSGQWTQSPALYFLYVNNGIHYSGIIIGCDNNESRQIIESMLK